MLDIQQDDSVLGIEMGLVPCKDKYLAIIFSYARIRVLNSLYFPNNTKDEPL